MSRWIPRTVLCLVCCPGSIWACSGGDTPSTPPNETSGPTSSTTNATAVSSTTQNPTTVSSGGPANATLVVTSNGSSTTNGNPSATSAGPTTGTGGATTNTENVVSTGEGGASTGASPSTSSGGSGGTGSTLSGGASGAFVCTPGQSYGDPLAGMGSIQEIAAPGSSYFAFIEGPVWVASLGTLFFSDNASSPNERIWKLVPPATTPEIFLEPSGSNGLAIDNGDQLIVADQKNKQLTSVDPENSAMLETIAGPGNFKPNDVIVRSDGNIYFTDPDSGFYRTSFDGEIGEPYKDVSRPNGIVLSPDENTLYVGDVGNKQIHAFALDQDGSVMNGSVFVTATNTTVDGMAVDCAGNLYAGTSNGVEVFSPSAEPLGTIPTGEASNATFGGSDRKTLYVTSRALLKYVTLAVPGLPD